MRIIAALLVAGLSVLPVHAADLSRAESFTLDNGLRIVSFHDASHPVVAVQMVYTAGARNEVPGITGIAHYLEHMLFRGTRSFPLADITGVIERSGGEWHGYTSLDLTTYFEAAPRDLLPTLLHLEAERMTLGRIAPDEVDPERGAVFQEYRGYQLDPRTELFDETGALLFQQHPYRYNTMGWESDLAEITHEDIVTFYRRYYGPRNAVLSIAGDFDPKRIAAQVEEAFGSIPRGGESTRIRTVEPPLTGQRRIVLSRPRASPAVMVAFIAPPPARPQEYAAFLVLDALLGEAKGLSFRALSGDLTSGAEADPGSLLGGLVSSGVAAEIGTSLVPTLYPYHYAIYATPGPGSSVDELLAAILATPKDLGGGVTGKEIATARRRIEAILKLETDSLVDIAHELAFWTALGGMSVRQKVIDSIGRVTPDDVRRMTRRLTPERAAVGVLLPEGVDQETAQSVGTGAPEAGDRSPTREISAVGSTSAAAPRKSSVLHDSGKPGRPAPERTTAPVIRTLSLGATGRTIVDARPGLDTFVLRLALVAGEEGPDSNARLRAVAEGVAGDTALAAGLGEIGVRFSVAGPGGGSFERRDTLQVLLQGPSSALAESLVVLEGFLRPATGERPGEQSEEPSDDPATRALQILAEQIVVGRGSRESERRSAGTAPLLTLASLVSPFTPESVRPGLERLVTPIDGDEPAQVDTRVTGTLAPGHQSEPLQAIPQGRLLIAIPGGEDPTALSALTWILHHDYSGRLGVKAIAGMGLVYSMDSETITRGATLAYFTMGASPESLPVLEKAMVEVLDRTARTITEEEVASFRSFARGDLEVSLSDPVKASSVWTTALLRGEDHDGPSRGVERAAALTRERVASFAKGALDPSKRLTVLIVRAPASADADPPAEADPSAEADPPAEVDPPVGAGRSDAGAAP